MNKPLCFLFLNLLLPTASAQTPVLRELKLSDEGRAIEVNAVCIDQNGMVIIAANSGIYYYNGQKCISMSRSRDNTVYTAVAVGKNNEVWAGTSNGKIERYVKYKPNAFLPEEGFPKKRISQIVADLQGNVWIATLGDGLYAYHSERLYRFDQADGFPDLFVYCIQQSSNNLVVCGTDRGFTYCSIASRKKSISKTVNSENGLKDNIVTDLEYLSANKLVVGTQDQGMQVYNEANKTFSNLGEEKGTINTICNIDGELWVGVQGEGIFDFEFRQRYRARDLHVNDAYNIRSVKQIMHSAFQSQLIVADNKLYITPGEWFEKITPPAGCEHSDPKAIAVQDDLLCAIYPAGLYMKNGDAPWQKINLSAKINLDAVSCVLLNNEHVFIGSLNEGIFVFNNKGKLLKRHQSLKSQGNVSVFCISKIENYILCGTMNGILAISASDLNFVSNNSYINKLAEAAKGTYIYDIEGQNIKNIYLGTDGDGIIEMRDGNTRIIPTGESSDQKVIYSLSQDHHGKVWFSSLYFGLFSLEKQAKQKTAGLDQVDNVPINALIADDHFNILTIHDDFLSIYNYQNGNQFIVQSDFGFSGTNVNDNLVDKSGERVYIASKGSISIFQPNRFRFYSSLPTIWNNTLVFLNPVSFDRNAALDLKHNENHVSIEVFFPWYFNQDAVKYEYVLVGDHTDSSITSSNLISFANLQPGKYRFAVRGTLQNARIKTPWTTIQFEIHNVWYKRWWALLLFTFGTIGLVYVIWKIRLKHELHQSQLTQFALNQELRAISSQVNPHFLFNSLNNLIALIENDPKVAVNYAELLSDFYRMIVLHKDAKTISLKEELKLSGIYMELQNLRFSGGIRYHVHDASKGAEINIPPMTIQILLENAIKHNQTGKKDPLTIDVYIQPDYLEVVNNRKPKLTAERSTNAGLKFVQERFLLLSGKPVEIEATDTFFKVKIYHIKNQ